jgi:hypothetical protein
VIFSNKNKSGVSVLEKEIRSKLIDGEFFVAEELSLPALKFERYDEELDHGWHEYFSVEETAEEVNDGLGRDVGDFVNILDRGLLKVI